MLFFKSHGGHYDREKTSKHTHAHAHTLIHTLAHNLKRFSLSYVWIDDSLTQVHPTSQIFYSQWASVLDNIAQAFMHYDVRKYHISPFHSIWYLRSYIFPKIVPYISHITIEYSSKLIQIITYLERSSTFQPSMFNR